MAINRIPEFIEALRVAETPEAVSELCKLEEIYLDTELATSSKKRAFTRYRNAIKESFGPEFEAPKDYYCSEFEELKSSYGFSVEALKFFRLSKEERSNLGQTESEQKHKRHTVKRKERGFISANDLILKAEELINVERQNRVSYIHLALGLMLLTGRRAIEVLKVGNLSKVSEFEVLFTGQAKTRDSKNAQTEAYVIPTLTEADNVIKALKALRELRDFSSLSNDQVHSKTNKSLNESVKRHFRDIVPNSSLKNLRQLYAAINLKWNYDEDQELKLKMSDQEYLARILGHTLGDIETANSYKDFTDLITD